MNSREESFSLQSTRWPTCAGKGCQNNECNLEVWREGGCSLYALSRENQSFAFAKSHESKFRIIYLIDDFIFINTFNSVII